MKRLRFLILQVIDPHYHQDIAIDNMAEAVQLVGTLGGDVVGKSIQHRVTPHPRTYIGGGKLTWVKEFVKDNEIDVVVVNDIVNAGQLFRLEQELWEVNTRIGVWDRVDLILAIFEQHATSIEAKLQIELARIEHMGPRIYGLGGTVLSKQGAGINTRGKGETNIEFERRKLKLRKQQIEKEIAHRTKKREEMLRQRKKNGVRTVALIGYTSAGKTTLFNALTQKRKETNRMLFTTLDTVVGKMKVSYEEQPLLVSDTIGFIDNLPPFLIDAFRSTLMESLTADILLHVVDASDPNMDEKIDVVEGILADLAVASKPVYVFTKTDTVPKAMLCTIREAYGNETAFFVSSVTGAGLDQLKRKLVAWVDPKRLHGVVQSTSPRQETNLI